MSQWKEDRNRLRDYVRNEKPSGLAATAVYVLISHMRGKIHMKYFNKCNMWCGMGYSSKSALPKADRKLIRAYGEYADQYHKYVYVGSLEDQANWFENIGKKFLPKELNEIAARVIGGYTDDELGEREVVQAAAV